MNALPLPLPNSRRRSHIMTTQPMDFDHRQDSLLTISEIVAYSYSPVFVPSKLEESYINTVIALARHADSLGTKNSTHISRTATLARAMGRKLGMDHSEQDTLSLAGLLHDVGKAFIPENILTKPSDLTPAEWSIMQQHPALGVKILHPVKKFQPVLPIILSHHEHFDGSGYPNGQKGDEIPLGARIICVVDAFTVMTAGRVYQHEMSRDEAIAELKRCSGTHFDELIVNTFTEMLLNKEDL